MVVEDNEINRTCSRCSFESLGIACLLAGRAAASLMPGNPATSSLMDIEMPGIDGIANHENPCSMRSRTGTAPVRGRGDRACVRRHPRTICQAGMHDFISKPAVMDELVGALRRGFWSKAAAAATARRRLDRNRSPTARPRSIASARRRCLRAGQDTNPSGPSTPRAAVRRMVPLVRIERTTYRLQGGCSYLLS